MHLLPSLLTLCTAATTVLAAPTTLKPRASTFEGKNLTILPLGDSITYGYGSTTSNPYRAALLTSLTTAGASINYIGSIQSGTLSDPDNEGRIGWTLEQIAGAVPNIAGTPNAVLLHAGTNDATEWGWEKGYERLGALIDVVTAKWPEAAVVVAKIVPSSNAQTEEWIEYFNARVQGVVDVRVEAGDKISVVDMSVLDAATDLSDELHPNDQGYEKMAPIWFAGLEAVNELGWL